MGTNALQRKEEDILESVGRTAEIFRRCEADMTLFGFSLEELKAARQAATREIHRYQLDREIAKRAREERSRKKAQKKGFRRPPRAKDPFVVTMGIIVGTHDEFGRKKEAGE